jgi:signal transduction histidine kinase
MHLFEIAALAAFLVNLALALFVLRQDFRSPLYRAYLVLGLGIAAWNISAFFLYRDIPIPIAVFWAKLLQFGIMIGSLGLYQVARIMSGSPSRPLVWYSFLAVNAVFTATLFTDWLVQGVRVLPFGHWAVPGPVFFGVMLSFSCLTIGSMVMLHRAARASSSLQRTRLRSLHFAIGLMLLGGSNDLLPILGYDEYPLIHLPFFPLGSIAACLYMTIVAYSVLQNMLLDVHVALGRFTAHIVRFGFLALCSLSLLLVMAALFPKHFNGVAFGGALLVQILSAAIAAALFPRLFGAGAETFERRILGDRLEYGDQVRTFVEAMKWFTDFPTLFSELHLLLTKTFRLESYTVLLRDVTGAFQLYRTHPLELASALPEMTPNSPIARYFEEFSGTCLTHTALRVSASSDEEEARQALGGFGAALCFALRSSEELVGFLMVGRKVSGDPFTVTDINLFTSLVKIMGSVVNQIRMKMQILQAQEFELLGRMSSGMAHDLNNLLTPVSTLLQLSGETGEVDDELLPVAARNVAAIRAYIREGLFFSEHHRLDFQPGRLDLVVARAIEVARASRTANVGIVNQVTSEVSAEMDHVMLQRLLSNLITNAMDASPEGSSVTVELDQLSRADEGRDWLRIRVIDQGQGIAATDLERVFTPYFTTKNTGDSHRGFGLGLAICRKIAALHGGELSIDSELNRGTTVVFDLPSKQIFPSHAGAAVNFRAA